MRRTAGGIRRRSVTDFNPRTREGCDPVHLASDPKINISIHAPVKGATRQCDLQCRRSRDFNPRTREGCDKDVIDIYAADFIISIHAPVKGATPNVAIRKD